MAVDQRKWVNAGYDNTRGAYLLDYYEDGMRQCTMLGYPDYASNVFRLYPHARMRYGKYPQVKVVAFKDVKSPKEYK